MNLFSLKQNQQLYKTVMDSSVYPLSSLPNIVRFQFMSMLAFMWSGIFSLWIGNLAVFGPSAIGHMILLLGVFFTADTFRRARRLSTSKTN